MLSVHSIFGLDSTYGLWSLLSTKDALVLQRIGSTIVSFVDCLARRTLNPEGVLMSLPSVKLLSDRQQPQT